MVSIKDIAKRAGVSISTVSYALNGSPKVTDETGARILAIAEELNYVPNAAARNLKKQETRIIGVFLTDFSGGFYGQLVQGMKDVLHKKGYDLVVCSGMQSHRMLPERMVDGAIVLDWTFDSGKMLQYADRGHKLVVLDRELVHPNVNLVQLDNKAGATLAAEYLIEQGHHHIYVVTGPDNSFDSLQRLQAVRQTVKRYGGVTLTEIPGDFNKGAGEAAARQIIGGYNGPCAVFCLNDEMALGFYNTVKSTEYRIGEHIHLIGFDNIEVMEYTTPRLATIDYSKKKWGALAAEQLLKLLSGESVENERIYVTLVKGESVGKVAT
ncbi:LacI family DNA-binding transcriptional regulator [Paenibacillus gansuensis]|uniref:LacI family DNA-binding transcriptional regulator n=1 Tax=Paenibacillus gansuensis TaxID=306542 RepID=A0ABW5P8C3_9BACL